MRKAAREAVGRRAAEGQRRVRGRCAHPRAAERGYDLLDLYATPLPAPGQGPSSRARAVPARAAGRLRARAVPAHAAGRLRARAVPAHAAGPIGARAVPAHAAGPIGARAVPAQAESPARRGFMRVLGDVIPVRFIRVGVIESFDHVLNRVILYLADAIVINLIDAIVINLIDAIIVVVGVPLCRQ